MKLPLYSWRLLNAREETRDRACWANSYPRLLLAARIDP